MNILEELQHDLKAEYETTKKFLERYPEEKSNWKPHEKSMDIKTLTTHIVETFSWPKFIVETDYLDFGETPYKQDNVDSKKEMLEKLDQDFQKGLTTLKSMKTDDLDGRWQLRYDGNVIDDWSKYQAIMHAFKQITHHRGQLSVYYRLNEIPVPGSYGPSADEME